jgi:RNA polymerase sigma factor (sigma-70 family)
VTVDARELVVLPPVSDDPIFSEPLPVPGGDPGSEPSVPRLIGSDPHDFAGLFMRHRWSFALHARRFLSDQRDIDEIVQEGFLKLFLAMPELETELQALAYARRTITNLCIDRYRADQRRPRLVDLESIPVDDLIDEDEIDPVVAAEDAAIVREALALLSPLHREALIKREVEEKPLPQIAAELDLPLEQVKHVLHRARRSLRRLLVGTHVEPGVDLDLAAVLAANRARAAAAAKPTGAAVVALLLVLAGVMGLRSTSSGSRSTVAGDVPHGPGVLDPAPPHGNVGGTTASGAKMRPATTPRTSGTPSHLLRPPTRPPSPQTPQPPTSHRPVTVPSTPVVGAPGGETPPSVLPDRFVVSGMGRVASVRVSDQQRDLRQAGTVSRSVLTAETPEGQYTLQQAFTFDATGSLQQVSLNEAVPLSGGDSVGTAVTASTTEVMGLANGSVKMQTSGIATPVAEVNGVAPPARSVTVTLLLAPDRVQVLEEHVTVSAVWDGSLPDAALPSPTASPPPPTLQPANPLEPVLPTGSATDTSTPGASTTSALYGSAADTVLGSVVVQEPAAR